jgi:phosphoesterase RecJ-like protein
MTLPRRLGRKQLDAAKRHLLAAHSVYAICHIMPDGDAVGSLLGLGQALTSLGKSCTLACADPIPLKFDFLPGAKDIVCAPPSSEQVIVTIDSSDVERLGSLYDASVFSTRPVINIDHHVTNTGFGTVHLVQSLPSAAEIVCTLLRSLAVPLDRDIATALLTGLVTDTRCFRTGNMTSRQLRTALVLMGAGASLAEITELVFNREPVSTVCLWGQSLANVQVRGRIMWTEINREMMRTCGASPNDGNGLVSFLASRMGVDAAVVFRETDDGRVEASMRAGPGWNISEAAHKLGGGGHPRAAGCTLAGSMDAVRDLVLSEIEAALREQQAGRSKPA